MHDYQASVNQSRKWLFTSYSEDVFTHGEHWDQDSAPVVAAPGPKLEQCQHHELKREIDSLQCLKNISEWEEMKRRGYSTVIKAQSPQGYTMSCCRS